jgi:uncharacterized membrane protein YqjE
MSRPVPEFRGDGDPGSVVAAGRRFLAAVWEHALIRIELFTLELAEERTRLIYTVIAAGSLIAALALTMTFAGIAILVAAWNSPYRVLVAASLVAFYAIAGIVAFVLLRELTSQKSPLFRHSLAELRRDVESFRP